MLAKVLVFSVIAISTMVHAETVFKKDQCTAEANKLLSEYQLGTLSEPNKAKFKETTCAEIGPEVAALKVIQEKIKKIVVCPANTTEVSNLTCLTKDEFTEVETMRLVVERLESLAQDKTVAAEKEKIVAENNKIFAKGATRVPADKKEQATKLRAELSAAVKALDIKLGKKPSEKPEALTGEQKALIEFNITSVCKMNKIVDKHTSGSQALAEFENQQSDFIRDYEAAVKYETSIKDKNVADEVKRQALIPELKKLEKTAKYYRENLLPAHNLLKKLALEEGAIDKSNLGAKIYLENGKVRSLMLENGNGILMSENCQLDTYSWYGVDVESDCMSQISQKNENYGDVCRKHFQFTNAKGYVKPAADKKNSQ